MQYNLGAIRKLIDASLSAEELATFCFDHFKFVYSQYGPASGHPKSTVVRALVEEAHRYGGMEKLLSEIEQANPYQYAKFKSCIKLSSDSHPFNRLSTGGLTFANIAIENTNRYWNESSTPPAGYPFERTCNQYFHLREFVSNVNPSFDVTVLNIEPTPLLVNVLGIEIVSVAHVMIPYGVPAAVKVKKVDLYSLEMPDIWNRIRKDFEGSTWAQAPSPVDLRELILMRLPDPIYMEANAPFRYGLYLENYRHHMPNNCILRLWVKTSLGECWSREIHVFTL